MNKQPGKIAVKAASVAEGFADAGTHEVGGENHGQQVEKFLRGVGLSAGAPWCAAFVHYCEGKAEAFLQTVGDKTVSLPISFPVSGYCPDYEDWARERGQWITVDQAQHGLVVPQRGDLVLFYFSAKGRVAHIGIVTGTFDGGVLTVEGNTSSGTGVNRDGDGAYRRRRKWSELGNKGGFVRMIF